MDDKYILDENDNPVNEPDLVKWGEWMGKANRVVKKDKINEVHISTVFLSINHNFGDGAPILWETMIFGGKYDQYQERYTTKGKAIIGHIKAIVLVTKG